MHNCVICGKEERAGYIEETKKRLIANQTCFNCDFWQCYIRAVNDPHCVRVNGKHYIIGKEDDGPFTRGFGGARWTIKFNDGRIVVSTNLWHQGEIPERFREQLPDNAVFC